MRLGIQVVITLLMAATLACGSAQPISSGTVSDQPKIGGIFTNHDDAEHEELDPTIAQQGGINFITYRVWESLLDVKTGPDLPWHELVIEPKLAERWEVSSDATRYTFTLRKDLKFANLPPVNGRQVTSADVKWSLEYIARIGQFKNLQLPATNQLLPRVGPLDRVETPDAYTVVAHMKEPFAPFLYYIAEGKISIFPHEVFDKDGRFSNNPIGTGPWQRDEAASQKGTSMVYTRNSNYWQEGKPYLDQIRSVIVRHRASAFAAFQTKQIDILNGPFEDAQEIQRIAPTAPFTKIMGNHGFRLWYNQQIFPFTDVRFRRAMSLATDRDEFVRTFTGGEGEWGVSGAVPGLFSNEELRKLYPYDPEQARRLVREAGYGDNPLSLEVHYSEVAEQSTRDLLLLQAQWKKVGINIHLRPDERVNVSRVLRLGEFVMQTTGTGAGEYEPDFYAYQYLHSTSGANYYNLRGPARNAKLDQMAEAQRREPDPAKRRELLREQVRYINEQGLVLWIYYAPIYFFRQSYVRNYYPGGPSSNKLPVEMWLDK